MLSLPLLINWANTSTKYRRLKIHGKTSKIFFFSVFTRKNFWHFLIISKLVHLITLSKIWAGIFWWIHIWLNTIHYLFYLFQVCQSKIIIISLHWCVMNYVITQYKRLGIFIHRHQLLQKNEVDLVRTFCPGICQTWWIG